MFLKIFTPHTPLQNSVKLELGNSKFFFFHFGQCYKFEIIIQQSIKLERENK